MVAERGNASTPTARDKAESFQVRKARLRASFLSLLPGRLADARRAVAELRAGEIDHAHLDALYVLFHTLKGSGATFGFQQISDAAKAAESAVRHAMDMGGPVEASLRADLDRLLDDMDARALAAKVTVDPVVAPGFELPGRSPSRRRPSRRPIRVPDSPRIAASG